MKTVMIVEDEDDVRLIIKMALESWGYQVLPACNGVEALDILKSEKPDIIISDVVMPEMDGFQFLKILKHQEETRSIPIIMLTQKDTFEDIYSSYEQGVDDYIPKPFDMDILQESLENILNAS